MLNVVRYASKGKTLFYCSECGGETTKWKGKCDACGAWNTLVLAPTKTSRRGKAAAPAGVPRAPQRDAGSFTELGKVEADAHARIKLPDSELNRLFGGGLVPGSVTVIGGAPGIGKSTLMMQLAKMLASGREGDVVAYVSGEESASQLKMRGQRLGIGGSDILVLNETDVDSIIDAAWDLLGVDPPAAREEGPQRSWLGAAASDTSAAGAPSLSAAGGNLRALVVDSVQTMQSAELSSLPGSVTQVRECAVRLTQFAKAAGVPVFLVGHVTKSGDLAGPRVLEHVVDTVLQLEGDGSTTHRLLRSVKNRFGATSEVGVFEMGDAGLASVANPSQVFLNYLPGVPHALAAEDGSGGGDGGLPDGWPQESSAPPSGTAVTVTVEGSRPLAVEIQALCVRAPRDVPTRQRAVGVPGDRLQVLVAVLNRRAGVRLWGHDVFVSCTGGLRLTEPAVDLSICAALASSALDRPLIPSTAAVGEVGLGGEVRSVPQLQRRVATAEALGFRRVLVPAPSTARGWRVGLLGGKLAKECLGFVPPPSVEVVGVRTVRQALAACLVGGSATRMRSQRPSPSSTVEEYEEDAGLDELSSEEEGRRAAP